MATLITVSLANTICIITVLHMYYEISALLLQLEIRLMQKATQYFASRSSTVVEEIERKKTQYVIKGDLKAKSTLPIKVVNFL